MNFQCYYTDHDINQYVMMHVAYGLKHDLKPVEMWRRDIIPISYGILRGTKEVFQEAVGYYHLDKGYWGAKHFNGYYRLSPSNLQMAYRPNKLPGLRLEKLNVKFKNWRKSGKHVLVLPPTGPIQDYYNAHRWLDRTLKILRENTDREIVIRSKGGDRPLEEDLKNCHCLVTFNSAGGFEALVEGVPVISDDVSLIGSFAGNRFDQVDTPPYCDREELFNYMSWSQFTLEEFKRGLPWTTPLYTSVGIQEK